MGNKEYKNHKIKIVGNDEDGYGYHITGEHNAVDYDYECPEFAMMAAEDLIDGLIPQHDPLPY